ncbi:class I tRNA ligase family protein, partial [Candidatus Dojkabacteria bacterium]|nr:class I tRNA ligase family protein [Candidatus Dojkabacteria bacterium]
TKEIFELIEILSKWYIRRSRERFVNGDLEALNTLYYVLVEISKLLAPFAPFVSESAYLTLTAGELKESVHLEDYPIFESKLLDEDLLKNMNTVREICSLGLNIRDENRIKLRQPLSKAYISIPDKEMLEIVKGELNVKKVEYSKKKVDKKDHITHEMGDIFVTMDLSITKELAEEGMVNEIVRGLQLARKERGCEMGEYVSIRYHSEDKEIIEVIKKHRENLKESIHLKEIKQVDRIDDGKRINVNENFLVIDIVK